VTASEHENETPALDAGRRARGARCVSNLALDRYLLDELAPGERDGLTAHLTSCHSCTEAHASLAAERERFSNQAPVASLAADALTRWAQRPRARLGPWVRRLAVPVLALCTGAAGLFLWAPTNRTKGGFSLSPYVLHPERASTGALHTGEPLHPRDRLQFRYNGPRGGYLAVVAIDESGAISVYYPGGPTAAAVEAGREVDLQSAVELDDKLGSEVVLAVRCDRPLAVSDVVRATHDALRAARARGLGPTELGPLGLPCDETRHRMTKTDRPGF
jgi:hypothetical protein